MKNQEAKFILGAYRPNGRDAGDATFGEALAQAEKDPELRTWFESQRKFDTTVSAKLNEIAPPAGLREAILAGSRVSATQAKRTWWTPTFWLAAAAAIALVATVAVKQTARANLPTGSQLAAAALDDVASHGKEHLGIPHGLDRLGAELADTRTPVSRGAEFNLDDLRKHSCRTVQIGGRQVFEICFNRDGKWYHVYVGRRTDFAPGALDPNALMKVQGSFAATAWADANHVYALVSADGAEVLKRAI